MKSPRKKYITKLRFVMYFFSDKSFKGEFTQTAILFPECNQAPQPPPPVRIRMAPARP